MYFVWILIVILISSVFFASPSIYDGIVMGKVFYFHSIMLIASVFAIVFSIFNRKNISFSFSLPDIFISLFFIVVCIKYDWETNLQPTKIAFGAQLLCLWYISRLLFRNVPNLMQVLLVTIMVSTVVECIIAQLQLYGIIESNHNIYKLTGTFYNPAPLAGWIAIGSSVSFATLFSCKRQENTGINKLMKYTAIATLTAMLIILPSTESRTAWIALIATCISILIIKNCKNKRIRLNLKTFSMVIVATIVIVIGCVGAYHLKKESANGRFFMWKIEQHIICEHPSGIGLGMFPSEYCKAQEEYFTNNDTSESEQFSAICPDYAFNEYLQICIENGVIGLLLFLCWIILCLIYSIKKSLLHLMSGIISICILSLASYPLQLPSFWIVLILMTALATSSSNSPISLTIRSKFCILLSLLTGALSIFITIDQYKFRTIYKALHEGEYYYAMKRYADAFEAYDRILYIKPNDVQILYKMSICMYYTKQYDQALSLVDKALEKGYNYSLFILKGAIELETKNYEDCAINLRTASRILPYKIYPYYLLTKLYSANYYYDEAKQNEMANIVLTKKPKVMPRAIQEMRDEVEKLLHNEKNSLCNLNDID